MLPVFVWLIIVLLINLIVLITRKIYVFWTTLYLIPTPPEGPWFGNLLKFLRNSSIQQQFFCVILVLKIIEILDDFFYTARRLNRKHGPIYRLSAVFVSAVALLEPNDIELVLVNKKHLTKTYIYNSLKGWLGTGLLTSKGRKWHQRRKILTPAFHFNILQQFVSVFNKETVKLINNLDRECGKSEFNVIPYITNFTLESIEETAMGFQNFDDIVHQKYKDTVYKMGDLLMKRTENPWYQIKFIYKLSALWQFERQLLQILHSFTRKIIDERQQKLQLIDTNTKQRLAMLDLLLAAKQNGADIDSEGIREEVDTFMFEGHDTTSMAISFLLLILANHPEIQQQVREEIFEIIGKTELPTYNQLQELKYTERCIKETLRLFPSVPFISRFAGETFKTTTGYTIPKGTILHLHIYDIHRNPDIYPQPEKFDPDRFLPENVNQRHPFAYIPFSAGLRNCIGQRYAILELKAALCGILRKFNLEPVDRIKDVKFKADLVLRPVCAIKIKISPLKTSLF